jgi:hypothetical protein
MKSPFFFPLRGGTILLIWAGLTAHCLAQTTVVSGKVTDAGTGDPLPFVNVVFKGTTIGATTDFDGFYKITTAAPTDSLVASYVGYATRAKAVAQGKEQTLHFQLAAEAKMLEGVVITPKGYVNPAWEIMDRVVAYKARYAPRRLLAYEYERYSRLELDIDQVSEKFAKRRVMREIGSVLDSAKAAAGEDGKPVIPVVVTEAVSRQYHRRSPELEREVIQQTKTIGVGVEDGSVLSQVIGSIFKNYNFYENWLRIGGKDFVSPLADGWKGFYELELKGKNLDHQGYKCFRIDFTPKRPQDLAFAGTMWVTDSTGTQPEFALVQIDLTVNKEVNLNFIEKIKIQQQLVQLAVDSLQTSPAWLPAKTRITVDVGEVSKRWAGMLAKYYTTSRGFVLNRPQPLAFYQESVTLTDAALNPDQATDWDQLRPDSLTPQEKAVYQMIDTIKKLPTVRTYVEVANILFNGYKKAGPLEFGPYILTYANNNVEGDRLRLGLRTNQDFAKRLTLYGMAAYGTRDNRWKHELGFDYLLHRRSWTQFGYTRSVDYAQLGLLADNFYEKNLNLFFAFARWGNLAAREPIWQHSHQAYLQTDLWRGVTLRTTFNRSFNEPYFAFAYLHPQGDGQQSQTNCHVTQLAAELRLSFGGRYIQKGNRRINTDKLSQPVLTLKYARGLRGTLGGDFDYHKLSANLTHRLTLGALGNLRYSVTASHIPSRLPYPLLTVHLGNETPFYNDLSFNLMRFFEFTSNSYVSFNAVHRFEGLLFNRLPLVRKWKWRSLATANVLYGTLDPANLALVPAFDSAGRPLSNARGLGQEPYVEVGYGIENIFRFLRVDFIHRLTYLDAGGPRFGVKISAQFKL